MKPIVARIATLLAICLSMAATHAAAQCGGFSATTTVTPASCNGSATGTATAIPAGGTAPYTYSWAPSGGTGATATGLTAGTYAVTVTDANACVTTAGATILQPSVLDAVPVMQTNIACNGAATGSATVSASGGTGAYTYSWSPSGGTAATASGLVAGTYVVTVTDANLCQDTQSFTLTQFPALVASFAAQTNITCNGGANGSATVGVTGGTPGYTYSWAPSGGTAQTANGLVAGTYTATVTDANSCTATQGFTISQPSLLVAAAGPVVPVSCNGGTDGTATVNASGGTAGYSYLWSPSGGTGATKAPGAVGFYSVLVTDGNGCTATQNFTINQPPVLGATTSQTNPTCNGPANGVASVNPFGGNGGYGFLWSPSGATTQSATELGGGAHSALITDAKGCTATSNFTLSAAPGTPLVVTPSGTHGTAAGACDGTASAPATGGNGAFGWTWSPSGGSAQTATGLCPGTYTATVTGGACTVTAASVVVGEPPGAPTLGAVTAIPGQVTVNFTPGTTGNLPIDFYRATCGAATVDGAGSPLVVTVPVGTPVTCNVFAQNAAGPSALSATSGSIVPAAIPGAPTIGTATPGHTQAMVTFTPPASDGGSTITGYTASCMPGPITATDTASPITVTGLSNSTAYTCSVAATNAVGTGPSSATTPVVPAMINYTGASATGTGAITASFTGGGAGCTFSTPQFIGPPPGATPIPPTAPQDITFMHGLFDFRTTGCTPGATLTFTILYPTALPAGTRYWKYGPTPTNASPHWYTLPATIVGNIATFTIADGGLGDDDLVANGTIVDQGGPGIPGSPGTATAIPTMGEWMLMLLALLMLLTVIPRSAATRNLLEKR